MTLKPIVSSVLVVCGALSLLAAKEKPDLYVQDSTRPWATGEGVKRHRPAPERVREVVPGVLLVEAEGFEDYGPWRLDSQFVHKMGSPYLIASGVGTPIGSARTTVDLPRAGTWRVWARTKDWLPEYSPGAFEVVVNGKSGSRLGVSRRVGWLWERAGDFELPAGPIRLELRDLTGSFGRCDALILTTDLAYVPPDEPKALSAERYRLRGESAVPVEKGRFDVIVVGAGSGGCPAAIAAARHGARVALIGDRPVLGGNGSDEIGVQMCGSAVDKEAARETGIVEEATCLRARYPSPGMSDAFARLVAAETNLTLFVNERMTEVETKDGRVTAVVCRNLMTDLRSRYEATVFVDATGDAWLGYFAGADYREGREGKDEHGEKYAPNHPDTLTMSGLLQEPSIGVSYWAEKTDGPVDYHAPAWAQVLPRGFTRVLYSIFGTWWLEHPAWIDDCANPEEARDELIRISFGFWDWVKNDSPRVAEARDYRLREIPIFDGRRETRRLVGDYVLTSTDLIDGRDFPDAVAYGGWDLDLHDPLGMRGIDTNGHRFEDVFLPFYSIPYRSLYSRNVPNLLMAGRDISVTHLALGSTRVQQTCAVIGQAVGTAAAMCIEYGVTPREIGRRRIGELQQRLLKDDAWILGRRNTDPADLARGASVSASSSATETKRFSHDKIVTYANVAPSNVIDGVSRPVGREAHAWVSSPGAKLPQWIRLDFPQPVTANEIRLTFDTDLEFNAWRRRTAEELVRDYLVEGTADGTTWFPLAEEKDNFQRQRIHRFAPVRLSAVRLTVRKTYGYDEANVFEIRVYGEKGAAQKPAEDAWTVPETWRNPGVAGFDLVSVFQPRLWFKDFKDIPDLPLFEDVWLSLRFPLQVNDLGNLGHGLPHYKGPKAWAVPVPAEDRYKKTPYRLGEVLKDLNLDGTLSAFEARYPGRPFSVGFWNARPSYMLQKTFDADADDFRAWRQRHPTFHSFDGPDEFDIDTQNYRLWRRSGARGMTNDFLQARLAEFPMSDDMYSIQAWTDESMRRWKSLYFGCEDLSGLCSIYPTALHEIARAGCKYLVYESEMGSSGTAWVWGGMCVRGAARQFRKPWGWYSTTFVHTTYARDGRHCPGNLEVKSRANPNAAEGRGCSRSLLRRQHWYGYLIGAASLQTELARQFFAVDGPDGKLLPSEYALDMNEPFAWNRTHDRGVAYTPVALLTSAAEPIMALHHRPWAKDKMSVPAFLETLVPIRSKDIHTMCDRKKGEEASLFNSPFADFCDVLQPDLGQKSADFLAALKTYRRAFLVGWFDRRHLDTASLVAYVKEGGTLYVERQQVEAGLVPETVPDAKGELVVVDHFLPEAFRKRVPGRTWWPEHLQDLATGAVPCVTISNLLMKAQNELLPVKVTGDVQWGVNFVEGKVKKEKGKRMEGNSAAQPSTFNLQPSHWLVWIFNNRGVTKFALEPQRINATAVSSAVIDVGKLGPVSAVDVTDPNGAGVPLACSGGKVSVTVGPGDIRLVELRR